MDAARRQIDASIRMTFSGEDPIAIHSVIAAGHRIIRDICEQRGDIESYLRFTDWIVPEHAAEFWQHMNASANFLKHADKDVHAIHELNEEESDFMIVFASRWYGDLGSARSREMNVFAYWWALQHPDVIKPKLLEQIKRVGRDSEHRTMVTGMAALSRADRQKVGAMMLGGKVRF